MSETKEKPKRRPTKDEMQQIALALDQLPDNWREWHWRDRKLFVSGTAQRLLDRPARLSRILEQWKAEWSPCFSYPDRETVTE